MTESDVLSSISSPQYLRLSLAAAMTLGLRPGRFYRRARLYCLNLLLTYPEGCLANCAYCGLSRSNKSNGCKDQNFIRVEWPAFPTDLILAETTARKGRLERICISMIMHPRAVDDTLYLIELLVAKIGLPVSVLVNPSTLSPGDLKLFQEAGADMASVAIDVATEELFNQYRGTGVKGPHKWGNYWQTLADAVAVFGDGNGGCHFITGLGETEQQMVKQIQRVHDLGGRSHMFSFFPEKGSQLESATACPAGQFRRVQLARFLIDYGKATVNQMEFDEQQRLVGFGLEGAPLDELVDSGLPFMTSGCPGKTKPCACNRPFGDGPPGDIRSYPFKLAAHDIQLVRKQLATYQDVHVPAQIGATLPE